MLRIFALAIFVAVAGPASADENSPPPNPPPRTINGITPPRAANNHAVTGYPEMSRHNNEEGIVTLHFTVNVDGTVGDVSVTKSSGYRDLDQAAIDTVTRNWRYYPAMKDGKPIAVRISANVNWELRDGAPETAPTDNAQPQQ